MSKYVKLADYINEIYVLGLEPHREDSGFVKIFRKLLTEEEIEIALLLQTEEETALEISNRTGMPFSKLEIDLHILGEKGIVCESIKENEKYYKLMPFVPGIFEALVGVSHDPDIANYLQDYADEMAKLKKQHNETVIPVNCKIDVQTQHVSLKEIELYLNQTDQYAVMDCICRTVQAARGKACGHPIKDMCILIGDYVDYYVKIGNARRVSKEEVYEVLLKAEAEGLFHEMYPIEKSKSIFVCNCCVCGCMFLELANRIKRVLRYEHTVAIEKDRCIQCGTCIESCPQQVFSWATDGTGIEIDAAKCFQCRLCEVLCEQHAIILD